MFCGPRCFSREQVDIVEVGRTQSEKTFAGPLRVRHQVPFRGKIVKSTSPLNQVAGGVHGKGRKVH
jgi:hypothetical protein